MRILFGTGHSYLPQRAGGSESSTHDLCIELQKQDIEPAVLASIEPDGWLGLRNRVERKLFRSRSFPMDRTMGYAVYRGWHPEQGVAEVVGRFRPDVAILQAGSPLRLARMLIDQGTPTIVYLRDTLFQELGGDVTELPKVRYIANSCYTASRFKAEFGLTADPVPPLVRPEAYKTESRRHSVTFINPHPYKGAETAFNLAAARPDIPFDFIEGWPLADDVMADYQSRVAALENVTWMPRQGDMRAVYANARVVIAPSPKERGEAWGRVVTEAQFSGIPVIASNSGGLPESVGPGGLLVEPSDSPDAWLEALSEVWDDEDRYRGYAEAALKHAQRPEIKPEVLIRKVIDICEHCRTNFS
ncbi:glycosyltransferase [Pelagibius sp. Alg239-R121]|uniref:glycosyltransferase n=1 Tax=Pelagibius sp. Alg239-R121 TaxID=2993448 RepID=UPI0024A6F3CD|nr:glycosyltransferase [Pelagibius sp. Alg239-R121]